jgi:hypothetical protein
MLTVVKAGFGPPFFVVMAGPVPAIHVFASGSHS